MNSCTVQRAIRLFRRVVGGRWRTRPDSNRVDLGEIRKVFQREVRVVLEIGANDGSDSAELLRAFPSASLYCFEPDPRAAAKWRQRRLPARARLFEIAVGEMDGEIDFYQSSGRPDGAEVDDADGWDMSGSRRRPLNHLKVHPWCRFLEPITVPVRSLDSWAAENCVSEVDFLWADVQGAEVDLVKGGKFLLSKTRLFYTEISDRELYEGQIGLDGLLQMLPGWRVRQRFPHDVLLEQGERAD